MCGFGTAAGRVGDCCAPLGGVEGVDSDGGGVGEEDSMERVVVGLRVGGFVGYVLWGVGFGIAVGGRGIGGPADAGDDGCEVGWEDDGTEDFEGLGEADLESVWLEGCDVEAVRGGEGVVVGLRWSYQHGGRISRAKSWRSRVGTVHLKQGENSMLGGPLNRSVTWL